VEFGVSVFRIEPYHSDRIVSFVYVLHVILLPLFTYVYYMYETYPVIHIGMRLVCFYKTRCDTHTPLPPCCNNAMVKSCSRMPW
jgi:hypothetical protein